MVVQGHIAHQGLLHFLAGVESVGFQNVRNAAFKPLNHAVGSGRSELGQSVLCARLLIHPTRCPVNGHDQIARAALVPRLWLEGVDVARATAAQALVQPVA